MMRFMSLFRFKVLKSKIPAKLPDKWGSLGRADTFVSSVPRPKHPTTLTQLPHLANQIRLKPETFSGFVLKADM